MNDMWSRCVEPPLVPCKERLLWSGTCIRAHRRIWHQNEAWRVEYYTERPHSSLGNRTPQEFASETAAESAYS
jgi:hypothetical protein